MTEPGFTSTMTALVVGQVSCANDPCEIAGCPVHDQERAE
jgi:hypothetical protein